MEMDRSRRRWWTRSGLLAWVKAALAGLLRLLYRVEVEGLENFDKTGERTVVVVNHVSFIDGALLAAFLPGRPVFAIDSHQAERPLVKPFLALVEAFPMNPANPFATKTLIRLVAAGKTCVIFPEGRITTTGGLMKIYEGPGMIADKADAMVVPVRIEGAQFARFFSYMQGKLRLRLFPKITITILEPRTFHAPPAPDGRELTGRRRRQAIGRQLYDVMSDMMFRTAPRRRTLFQALLDARALHGGKAIITDDVERRQLSYDALVLGSLVLGRRLARDTAPAEMVGVMLPNAAGTIATFFALQAFGRVPALLNFTTGAAGMAAACRAAGVRTVLTSRRFVERARLDEAAARLGEQVRLVHLEDVREAIGLVDKLAGLVMRPAVRLVHGRQKVQPDDPAVVLFTSGSEGAPKGVALSHENILANCRQVAARIDFNPTDIVLNVLPVFHSFGLTGGTILPVLSGVKTFMYPSPLHYRIVPEWAYGANATIMFGTDTFLTGYARMAHPYDFYAMRYVFAGAEKVRDETRRTWLEKFGVRLLEGYGVTECSPVLALNTPMHNRPGTVGRLLPGIRYRVEPVEGIDTGGRLHVAGPNVMLGYLRDDEPGVIQPPPEGWYDTGDIVDIDEQGFVHILGRAKRFAKVGGEMISLGAVEALAGSLWPDRHHAAVTVPDARKGEQIMLVTDQAGAEREALHAHARATGRTELMVPKSVKVVDKVPVLGTGKTDYVAVQTMVAGTQSRQSAA